MPYFLPLNPSDAVLDETDDLLSLFHLLSITMRYDVRQSLNMSTTDNNIHAFKHQIIELILKS